MDVQNSKLVWRSRFAAFTKSIRGIFSFLIFREFWREIIIFGKFKIIEVFKISDFFCLLPKENRVLSLFGCVLNSLEKAALYCVWEKSFLTFQFWWFLTKNLKIHWRAIATTIENQSKLKINLFYFQLCKYHLWYLPALTIPFLIVVSQLLDFQIVWWSWEFENSNGY